MNVRVIGRGKLGRTLHAALSKGGLNVRLERGRSLSFRPSTGMTVYLIAVPDAQIRGISTRLSSIVHKHDIVLHGSGNRGPEELVACQERGAHVAAMHPMVSFASARKPSLLAGTMWIARGDERALRIARKLARAAGARCVAGPAGNPAYHAAAATIGNGSAALAHLTVRMLRALELDQKTAERAVAGMLRSVASNVERLGVPAALTGPIVRGDAATIADHVRALHKLDPSLARDYIALAPLILTTAREAGLAPAAATRIKAALTTSKGKRRSTRPE